MAFNLLNNILNESLISTKQISNACVIGMTELKVKAKTPNIYVIIAFFFVCKFSFINSTKFLMIIKLKLK